MDVCLSVCCECFVLSGRGLCDWLITRLEISYRLWCVVECDLATSRMRRPWPTGGCHAKKKSLSEFVATCTMDWNYCFRTYSVQMSLLYCLWWRGGGGFDCVSVVWKEKGRSWKILFLRRKSETDSDLLLTLRELKHLKFYVMSGVHWHIATLVRPTISVPISLILSKSREIIPSVESHGLWNGQEIIHL